MLVKVCIIKLPSQVLCSEETLMKSLEETCDLPVLLINRVKTPTLNGTLPSDLHLLSLELVRFPPCCYHCQSLIFRLLLSASTFSYLLLLKLFLLAFLWYYLRHYFCYFRWLWRLYLSVSPCSLHLHLRSVPQYLSLHRYKLYPLYTVLESRHNRLFEVCCLHLEGLIPCCEKVG